MTRIFILVLLSASCATTETNPAVLECRAILGKCWDDLANCREDFNTERTIDQTIMPIEPMYGHPKKVPHPKRSKR